MENTSNKERLYYIFAAGLADNPSSVEKDSHDDYVIYIGNSTELREHCRAIAEANGANADRVETAIALLVDWMADGDFEEVGVVEEEGWYEPPHYNYADPAAACDADGDTTSATVDVHCSDDDIEGGAYHNLEEVIGFMYHDDVVDDEEEKVLRVCLPFIARWVAIQVNRWDGNDVL